MEQPTALQRGWAFTKILAQLMCLFSTAGTFLLLISTEHCGFLTLLLCPLIICLCLLAEYVQKKLHKTHQPLLSEEHTDTLPNTSSNITEATSKLSLDSPQKTPQPIPEPITGHEYSHLLTRGLKSHWPKTIPLILSATKLATMALSAYLVRLIGRPFFSDDSPIPSPFHFLITGFTILTGISAHIHFPISRRWLLRAGPILSTTGLLLWMLFNNPEDPLSETTGVVQSQAIPFAISALLLFLYNNGRYSEIRAVLPGEMQHASFELSSFSILSRAALFVPLAVLFGGPLNVSGLFFSQVNSNVGVVVARLLCMASLAVDVVSHSMDIRAQYAWADVAGAQLFGAGLVTAAEISAWGLSVGAESSSYLWIFLESGSICIGGFVCSVAMLILPGSVMLLRNRRMRRWVKSVLLTALLISSSALAVSMSYAGTRAIIDYKNVNPQNMSVTQTTTHSSPSPTDFVVPKLFKLDRVAPLSFETSEQRKRSKKIRALPDSAVSESAGTRTAPEKIQPPLKTPKRKHHRRNLSEHTTALIIPTLRSPLNNQTNNQEETDGIFEDRIAISTSSPQPLSTCVPDSYKTFFNSCRIVHVTDSQYSIHLQRIPTGVWHILVWNASPVNLNSALNYTIFESTAKGSLYDATALMTLPNEIKETDSFPSCTHSIENGIVKVRAAFSQDLIREIHINTNGTAALKEPESFKETENSEEAKTQTEQAKTTLRIAQNPDEEHERFCSNMIHAFKNSCFVYRSNENVFHLILYGENNLWKALAFKKRPGTGLWRLINCETARNKRRTDVKCNFFFSTEMSEMIVKSIFDSEEEGMEKAGCRMLANSKERREIAVTLPTESLNITLIEQGGARKGKTAHDRRNPSFDE